MAEERDWEGARTWVYTTASDPLVHLPPPELPSSIPSLPCSIPTTLRLVIPSLTSRVGLKPTWPRLWNANIVDNFLLKEDELIDCLFSNGQTATFI